jgi:hypothetical protein
MQKKIENFFTVKVAHSQTIKKCFIYDPSIPCASFEYEPRETDRFLSTESGMKLYYRPDQNAPAAVSFPVMNVCDAPLLISNIQKAIRRRDAPVAIQSALALVQQHSTKLLRRLPVIYIEDVTIMDSFPIVIWWMMAEKEYTLDHVDMDHMLNMVWCLATHEDYYENDRVSEREKAYTHEELQSHVHADHLLALHYRSQYGGMKGDMRMLVNAIEYVKNKPSIDRTIYRRVDATVIPNEIEILMESIDFHPLPQLLIMLQKKTNLKKEVIKECIWYAESGVNVRKPVTLQLSKEYQEKWEWRVITMFLDEIRHQLVS